MITIRNIMKIGGLVDCKLVAGQKGADKEVNYVTIMEVPDLLRWLKGKELILTSLFPIKDDKEAQQNLIRQLHELGSSALAIKPHRFVEEIPDIILAEAEKYGFPIIEIPEQISYLDILEPAMNAIFDNKVVLQKDIDQANQLLNEISINAQGIERLIETLCYLTKNEVTLESELAYVKFPVNPFSFDPLQREQMIELALLKRPVRMKRTCESGEVDCIVSPILIDGKVYGNITCWGVSTDLLEIDLAVLERASILLSLEFLKSKVKFDVEHQYKNEFLRDLLLNENVFVEDMKERGKRYNYSVNKRYICLALNIGSNGEASDHMIDKINQLEYILTRFKEDVLCGELRGLACILYPIQADNYNLMKNEIANLLERLKKHLSFESPIRIGIGRFHEGIFGIRESFREAEKAVYLGRIMWSDESVIHYNDLGAFRLISQISDIKELRQFYEDTIGKLVESDRDSELDLIQTLRIYFKYQEKLVDTAQALFIHVNTLKYRLQKVEKITGFGLNLSESKLMLHLGLKIYDLMSSDYRFR